MITVCNQYIKEHIYSCFILCPNSIVWRILWIFTQCLSCMLQINGLGSWRDTEGSHEPCYTKWWTTVQHGDSAVRIINSKFLCGANVIDWLKYFIKDTVEEIKYQDIPCQTVRQQNKSSKTNKQKQRQRNPQDVSSARYVSIPKVQKRSGQS